MKRCVRRIWAANSTWPKQNGWGCHKTIKKIVSGSPFSVPVKALMRHNFSFYKEYMPLVLAFHRAKAPIILLDVITDCVGCVLANANAALCPAELFRCLVSIMTLVIDKNGRCAATVMKLLQTAPVAGIMQAYKNGITGCTLKIIAIISMIIDHLGSIILDRALIRRQLSDVATAQISSAFIEANAELYYGFFICKIIGRIAFPIFCFLLVEGFLHTHNLTKYLGRMALFAFISEIPFDLAFFGVPFYWGYQNVYFTLLFGMLAITGIQLAEQKKEWHMLRRILICILIVGLCASAAIVLCADYNIFGILSITIIYLFRKRKTLSVGLGCIPLHSITSFVSLIPIHLYNGKRGKRLKWIFYLFYPVHIFLLYLVTFALGLGDIPLF